MEIEIRRLTPDLAEDYVQFFDVTPHDVNIDEQKCYCVTWRSDISYANGAPHWFPAREERRTRAKEFVRTGSIQGYLAYYGDKIVGWCNANADCQLCVNYLRSYWPKEEYRGDVKVKSVFCFVVAPEMQRKGIATQLLKRVCKDAANEGFDFVEEMDNVAGSKAAVIELDGSRVVFVNACNHKNISLTKFKEYLYVENTCPVFEGRVGSNERKCINCLHSESWAHITDDTKTAATAPQLRYAINKYDVEILRIQR